MDQEYLEKLVERLLEQKNISAKEAVELLKLNQPQKEYISVPIVSTPWYYWEYRPYIIWNTTSEGTATSTSNCGYKYTDHV